MPCSRLPGCQRSGPNGVARRNRAARDAPPPSAPPRPDRAAAASWRSRQPDPDRSLRRRRVDGPATLGDHGATLGLQPTRRSTRGLHQRSPLVATHRPCRFAGTDGRTPGAAREQTHDRCLELSIDPPHTATTACSRAMANLVPGTLPRLAPRHRSTTNDTGLRDGLGHDPEGIHGEQHRSRPWSGSRVVRGVRVGRSAAAGGWGQARVC